MAKPWLKSYEKEIPHTLSYPDYPVPQFLIDTAARSPESIATTFNDVDITFGQLNEKVNALAHVLQALGIKKAERVALLLPNSPTYVIAFYAVLKIGATVVNINVMTHGEELLTFLNYTGAKLVVTLDLFVENVFKIVKQTPVEKVIIHSVFGKEKQLGFKKGICKPLIFNDLLAAQSTAEPAPTCSGSDTAVLQFTGGTTGTPKAAVLTHRNIVSNVMQVGRWHRTHDSVNPAVICILPFFHVFGMMICLNLAVAKGYRMILIPMFDWSYILNFLEMIKKYRPISFPAVPSLWAALVSHPRAAEYSLDAIKVPISGGAPLPVWVQEKFVNLTGRMLGSSYGLTEASSTTHLTPFGPGGKPGSVGIPLPDTDARIVDIESGKRQCPIGEIGELIVKGPQIMSGYWQNPELTARTIRNGWLYTGDLARMDADGFFYLVDRKDDLIISGGFNVYPSDVERVLGRHPQIKDTAVIGVPDRIRGESILAFVVTEDDARPDKMELLAYCREHLASFKVPKAVIYVDRIPKSPVGKPLRKLLRQDHFRSKTA